MRQFGVSRELLLLSYYTEVQRRHGDAVITGSLPAHLSRLVPFLRDGVLSVSLCSLLGPSSPPRAIRVRVLPAWSLGLSWAHPQRVCSSASSWRSRGVLAIDTASGLQFLDCNPLARCPGSFAKPTQGATLILLLDVLAAGVLVRMFEGNSRTRGLEEQLPVPETKSLEGRTSSSFVAAHRPLSWLLRPRSKGLLAEFEPPREAG